jgi:hypothetical protein
MMNMCQEYIKYFTSLSDILYLPSYCAYVNTRYRALSKNFLLAPARGINPQLVALLDSSLAKYNKQSSAMLKITPIRELYPIHFEYSDLASHAGIVLLPYQVSFMSLFEFYRMQIPLFIPSLALLTTWHLQFHLLSERTWDAVHGHPSARSLLARHPNSSCSLTSDPNDEFSPSALLDWLAYSDFYQWPHVVQFDSFAELFRLLQRADLPLLSQRMGAFNAQTKQGLKLAWKEILDKVRRFKQARSAEPLGSRSSRRDELPAGIDDALHSAYGYRLSPTDCHAQIYS